jgi:hypothetical protein
MRKETKMIGSRQPRHRLASAVAGLAVMGTLVTVYSAIGLQEAAAAPSVVADSASHGRRSVQKEIRLYTSMRRLWTDHMQYTYTTVDAFFNNPDALQPTLARLLRNQRETGDAFIPYYGKAAGDHLGDLLTTHIKLAVPVLEAAQAGDEIALNKALDDWYANAAEIADFLTVLNPRYWPNSVMQPLWKKHITQTTAYSVDLLKGDYARSIKDYDKAFDHMMVLSDILSQGIIGQFPNRFCE